MIPKSGNRFSEKIVLIKKPIRVDPMPWKTRSHVEAIHLWMTPAI
jgi:hypothetical protein